MTKWFSSSPSLPAQRQIVRRVQKRFHGEAAENAREHFRAADAGGEIEPRHGLGGTDEMRGDSGGVTFGGGKNPVGQRALKRAEGRAVNVVDDHRHARAPGREAAENSRLAAVGVDDVGLLFAQDFFQLAQREPVFQRMNRADEFGHAREDFRRAGRIQVPANLRGRWSGRRANGLRRRVFGAGRARRRRCFPARRRRPAG